MKKVAVAIHATKDFDPSIIDGLEGLDYIHVDVMDGKFVDTKNDNLDCFRKLKEIYKIPIVAHLMVIDPLKYIHQIITFTDIILFHFEIDDDINQIIEYIKDQENKVGFVINPKTSIHEIISYLPELDYVLIMSVNPGWSGQKFIPNTIEKVNELSEYKKKHEFKIMVDGGINLENAKKLSNSDILCSSSTILKAEKPNDVIKTLKQL